MKLLKSAKDVILDVYIKPNSNKRRIKLEGDKLVVSCRDAPVKGKANRELVKELSRLFNRKVKLISGFHSRQKKILISNIEAEEVKQIVDSVSAADTRF